jgi:putative magnesium chelatase accessory protein
LYPGAQLALNGPHRWESTGRDWPNRDASRFVRAAGLRWHVQIMGHGPALLLVHGTGAATHSWRDLAPLLAPYFTVVAPDLPGHGFSQALEGERQCLTGMADSLAQLLEALDQRPLLAAGHSAGAAILARMSLDGRLPDGPLVSLNGALLPLRRHRARNSLVARLLARQAQRQGAVERLLASTGSALEPLGIDFYRRLARDPAHVAAVMAMMSNWDLRPLVRELPRLKSPLVLVVGSRDSTVPPEEAERVSALVPNACRVSLPGLGHLAHEEQPRRVAALLLRLARRGGCAAMPPRSAGPGHAEGQ